jgi:hypothetical protein
MLRIIRDHEDPFHQVVMRCDDNIVSIHYKGKTRTHTIKNRIPSHLFACVCWSLSFKRPREAFHEFDMECKKWYSMTKKQLKECALESGFHPETRRKAPVAKLGTSLDGIVA